MPRLSEERNLQYLRRSRSLEHYIDNAQLLIQPMVQQCSETYEVDLPVVILVASAPAHYQQRKAVRKTWAKYQPTYFVLGLDETDENKILAANRAESDLYGDVIVFDFNDHYQNLTLKTALMMYWTLNFCPKARFLLKTDDDALVNPWKLNHLLNEIHDSNFLLGHKHRDSLVERNEYNRWYMPRWLYRMEVVPEHLDQCGYLMSVKDLLIMFKNAYKVPLVNLESVYITYMVAAKSSGLYLQDDKRFTPKKTWLNMACLYWCKVLAHGYSPEEMASAWSKMEGLANTNNTNCHFIIWLLSNNNYFWH